MVIGSFCKLFVFLGDSLRFGFFGVWVCFISRFGLYRLEQVLVRAALFNLLLLV